MAQNAPCAELTLHTNLLGPLPWRPDGNNAGDPCTWAIRLPAVLAVVVCAPPAHVSQSLKDKQRKESTYLVGICDQVGRKLGRPRCTTGTNPMYNLSPGGGPSVLRVVQGPAKTRLQSFIQNQMQRRLDRPEVTRAQSTIQPPNALMSQHLSHTIDAVPVPPFWRLAAGGLRPVELQSCLDEPDRVRGRRRCYPRENSGLRVYQCGILPAVQPARPQSFAIPVHVEFNRCRRYYPRQTGSQPAEKRRPAFYPVDGADNRDRAGFRFQVGSDGGRR